MYLSQSFSQNPKHPGICCTSSLVQYFRILSAPNCSTSSARWAQRTSPNESMTSFSSANLSSRFPDEQSSTYVVNFSRPAWISLCWLGISSSWRKAGILFARNGKTYSSSIPWCISSSLQKSRPAAKYCLSDMLDGRFPDDAAEYKILQVDRKCSCCSNRVSDLH